MTSTQTRKPKNDCHGPPETINMTKKHVFHMICNKISSETKVPLN